MKRIGHGVISLALIATALLIGMAAMSQASIFWGMAYLVMLMAGATMVLYSFCAKCPCREHGCGHVIPGLLARWLFARPQTPYGLMDMLGRSPFPLRGNLPVFDPYAQGRSLGAGEAERAARIALGHVELGILRIRYREMRDVDLVAAPP